ncbi:MAG: CotH kinase family protein [Paludibacter sp.]|nr:CotH kinase family protein [Bacteroidales bacterium]MCM1068460.1 CotH kinase family protein [Prevotella sp.]MCM1353414.1 CotH kinase family protein [Bacteroides sp.]MCM1442575.1 CotH kinase family protein [Muribaculum sp.]MCM1481420.1 CotH kinase family protein [Paludibacter sp.]
MKQQFFRVCVALLGGFSLMPLPAQDKLTGTVIGTQQSVDYATGAVSTTINTAAMAHDGDLSTYFASYDRQYTWTGLDLGAKYIISKVGWSPRNDGVGPERVVLGIFEGANQEDFMDAVPIFMITERGTIGQMSYADVDCSRGFRYVRYVGPANARCNIAEVEFYGVEGNGDDTHLYQLTNLPTVIINTHNAEAPYDKEHDIVSNIIVISKEGSDVLEKQGTSRLRGNASMQFEKKPYRIKFDKKQSLLDAPATAKKWTLINNYGDKTLMRNIVAFEASRRSGLTYTPFCQSVDVVLNGEYKGNYQLCDQVEVNKNKVSVVEMAPTDIAGEELTGGYFLEVDGYADQELSWFNSARGIPVTIKSPKDDEIVPQQKQYIADYFNKMESLVYANGNGETYDDILDLPSFLRLFLIGEFSGNTDTYWSTYIYKERSDKKMYFGPVWDFDIAFDNDYRTYPINNKTDYVYRSGGSSAGSMSALVTRVINRPEVTTQLQELWQTLRDKQGFSENSFCAYIDSIAADLDASQRLNFMRWKMLQTGVHMNPVTYATYEQYVDALKQYVTNRIAWLDRRLNYVPASGVESVVSDTSVSVYVRSDGEVVIIGTDDVYMVYDATGRLCGRGSAVSPARLSQAGVYVVSVAGQSFKIVL